MLRRLRDSARNLCKIIKYCCHLFGAVWAEFRQKRRGREKKEKKDETSVTSGKKEEEDD